MKDWPVVLLSEKPAAMILPSGWMRSASTASLPLKVVVRTPPLPKPASRVPSGLTPGQAEGAGAEEVRSADHGLPVGLDGHCASAVQRLVQAGRARVVERRAGRREAAVRVEALHLDVNVMLGHRDAVRLDELAGGQEYAAAAM
jgi:hypothetical protein